MIIDLGNETKITVRAGGSDYMLRAPKFDDFKKMKESEDQEQAFYQLLIDIGLPEDVTYNLDVLQLKKLSSGLTGVLGEKK